MRGSTEIKHDIIELEAKLRGGDAEVPRPPHHAPPLVWVLKHHWCCNACGWHASRVNDVPVEPEACPKCGAGPCWALLPKES